jgi:hypothetical protein
MHGEVEMNWDAIGAIGEIIGAVAVVVTLVYVAHQIRENSRQLKLVSLTDTFSVLAEAFNPILNNEHNLRVWTTGLEDPSTLEKTDLEAFYLFATRVMAAIETVVEHYELGTIDDERFTNHMNFGRSILASPGGAKWLGEKRYELSSAAKKVLQITDGNSA